ncbi:MAG TPA: sigma-70 family RNA polymerase sigma factor [Bryobacteraceae bacterium]|nr:sigma-70 family RNA polymerase sigma factor [Bryobacteraceae bacterium]
MLRRAQDGDEEAFIQLYRRRQGAIYRFAYHMTGSAATAEDVAQDVFLALMKTGGSFDPARGSLSAYLFGIARKLVLRHLDRSRYLIALDSEGQDVAMTRLALSTDPMVDLMRREGLEQLRQAVLTLPKRYREVVALCDLQEMDYVAAAATLDCPVGTVRSRLHRARGLLLEKLQKQEVRPVGALKPARSLI